MMMQCCLLNGGVFLVSKTFALLLIKLENKIQLIYCKNLLHFLKMSTYNEPKESTYYSITPLGYMGMPRKPFVQIDGHFRVLEAERPELPYGMKYKVELLTGTNNRNFYKDLEEMISTMEHENKDFQKRTILK